jgi:hypothetical protein
MLAAPSPVRSCAPVAPPGAAVHLDEESAIVIWDAASRTQHFVRRAAFRTQAKDFGFLVPTPAVPELAEADDYAFELLAKITAPKTVDLRGDERKAVKAAASAAAPVVVVATAKVAGYDAAVLEATDAAALDRWLKDHGYVSSPALVEWYRPYIAQGWKITAFKIAREPQTERVATGAVRMSFRTERPFFPYREPGEADTGRARLLRIFFIGDGRFFGALGLGSAWNGETAWSGPLADGDRQRLLDLVKLPKDAAPGATWLTEFEDRSSPRPAGADLVFAPMGDRSVVTRPDIVEAAGSGWGDLVLLAVLAALLLGVMWLVVRLARWVWRG